MAMLLVLMTLVISVTTATIAAQAVTATRLSDTNDKRSRLCDDLAREAHAPLRDWLADRAHTTVLAPEIDEPCVVVLHDWWTAGGDSHEITITAWDQCGMTPVAAAASGHGLAQILPDQLRARASDVPREWLWRAGLDQLGTDGLTLFPVAPPLRESAPGRTAGRATPSPPDLSIGACLATHNPPVAVRSRRGVSPVLINVNTSPPRLLRHAFRLAGLGGVDLVLDARENGLPATLGLLASTGDASESAPIRFVGASPSWGVRIDVRVGSVRRSWWEVWINTSGQWEVTQRLAIHE